MTSTLALSAAQALSAAASLKRKRLGVVIHSYWQRWHGKHSSIAHPAFTTPMDVLDHVRGLGVGSLQITVHDWKDETAADMRATSESYGVKLEGSVGLPKNADDVARFEHELRLGKAAGMTIFRSWIGGRRYEDFSTREAFEDFKERAMKSLRLAEPLVRRHGVRLGVENHKDFHAPELVEMLSKIGSDQIGVCIDLGNSLALLEDPLAVVETLAPLVVTTHVKDIAVMESAEGFHMAEVPLGEGILDLPRMFELIEAANPRVEHHLEMITRDPLDIPCLKERYWATFPDKPGMELARTLSMVRARKAEKLPKTSGKTPEAILALEEENNVKCLRNAADKLGFQGPPKAGKAAAEEK